MAKANIHELPFSTFGGMPFIYAHISVYASVVAGPFRIGCQTMRVCFYALSLSRFWWFSSLNTDHIAPRAKASLTWHASEESGSRHHSFTSFSAATNTGDFAAGCGEVSEGLDVAGLLIGWLGADVISCRSCVEIPGSVPPSMVAFMACFCIWLGSL